MIWHAQLALVPGLACLAAASCTGKSDDCSSNPSPLRRVSPLNFHTETCNLKWTHGCTILDKHGQLQQKPPAFSLCDTQPVTIGLPIMILCRLYLIGGVLIA